MYACVCANVRICVLYMSMYVRACVRRFEDDIELPKRMPTSNRLASNFVRRIQRQMASSEHETTFDERLYGRKMNGRWLNVYII